MVALLPTAGLAIPLAVVSTVTLIVRMHDAAIGVVEGVGWGWLFVPLVLPLYRLVAVKAVSEYTFCWESEWYHVEKGKRHVESTGSLGACPRGGSPSCLPVFLGDDVGIDGSTLPWLS